MDEEKEKNRIAKKFDLYSSFFSIKDLIQMGIVGILYIIFKSVLIPILEKKIDYGNYIGTIIFSIIIYIIFLQKEIFDKNKEINEKIIFTLKLTIVLLIVSPITKLVEVLLYGN